MDCFRIPSVLTEALDQQAACFSLSFTLYLGFQQNSHFGKGEFSKRSFLERLAQYLIEISFFFIFAASLF